MIDVAYRMPDVPFTLVMPTDVYNKIKDSLPQNVTALHNIPISEFVSEMCKASLVALPLNTDAPAGLIVLFQAAANEKYILTTDTMTTREYLAESRGCLLPNEVAAWQEAINHHLCTEEEKKKATAKMLAFLETQCSEEEFVRGVEEMIKQVK